MNKLQLISTKHFNGSALDCYIEAARAVKGDFWATREQIGTLLEYENPRDAVAHIHMRNKERLDRFSGVVNLSTPNGGTQLVTVYNFKGLLEICRYSQQPKADAVMDWLWDVADEIRRTGSYSVSGKRAPRSLKFFKTAEALIDKAVRCKTECDRQSVRALDRLCQDTYGCSILEVAGIELEAQPEVQSTPAPQPRSRSIELWEHIVSTFAPNEWFTTSELIATLEDVHVGTRQIRRHLASFVASKKLCKRGSNKGTEYSIK